MNQRGFAPIAATLLILAGIIVAVYLTLHSQIFSPHASTDITRAEFVDSNGNDITQTTSRNVIVKLTYVPNNTASVTSGPNSSFQLGANIETAPSYGYGDLRNFTSADQVDTDLQALQSMGATLVRVFVGNDRISDAEAASRLDKFLTKAQSYNISVIPVLIDYYGSGHNPQGVDSAYTDSWNNIPLLNHSFYSQDYKGAFKSYVQTVVSVNKNYPNIYAWEIGNELEDRNSPQTLVPFMSDMASFIKGIDPLHKIASGVGSAQASGVSDQDLYGSSGIDVVTIHSYSGDHSATTDASYAKQNNKIAIVEEAGFSGNDRSGELGNEINFWKGQGVSAFLHWGFIAKGLGDNGDGDKTFGFDNIWHNDYDQIAALFKSDSGVNTNSGSVSTSGSSTVTQTGNGSVDVQFSGPSASVGGGSVTSSNSQTQTIQNTTTVTENGQTITTTNTGTPPNDANGNPILTAPDQFPTNFRIANSLGELSTAQTQTFTQNQQQVNWLLDSGDGLKQIFVQFLVGGIWQPVITASITLNSEGSSIQTVTPSSSPTSQTTSQSNTANAKAFFVLQQGTAIQVPANTSNTGNGTTAVPSTNPSQNPAPPQGTPTVTGGTTQNGVPQGGKITLPNGQVLQGGNGTGTSGVVPNVKGVSTITQIPVKLLAESDDTPANLFNAKLIFDPSSLQVAWIDTSGSFIVSWVVNNYDNSAGVINLTGGLPDNGIQTSGSPKLMATIYFVPLRSGASTVSFDPSSAIYSNSGNSNIISASQSLALSLPGQANPPIVVVSPPPGTSPVSSVVPSALPSSVPTSNPINPSVAPSVLPQPTQVSTSGPVASSPGNSSSSSNTTCTIDQTHFVDTGGTSVPSGSVVTVTVTGSSSCNGQTVNFSVAQDNGLLGQQAVSDPPPAATFNGGSATSTWVTKSNDGVLGGLLGPSGYSLTASLPSSNQSVTSSQDLHVSKQLLQGFKKGDINHDGSISLEDLSAFFADFYKNGAPSEADFNGDGIVNSFDFGSFLALLKQQGVISSSQ